jgi:hypothetical protein
MSKDYKVERYEDAVKVVQEVGILPLSSLIPNHPSLESITNKSDWYTSTSMDPWLWRVRFAGDGSAAYGKFIKKKSILIATELVPWIKAIIGNQSDINQRYADGLISATELRLYQLIENEPGIETRALRAASGLKATEHKKEYDQAITDLQASMDIVISGVHERFNDAGDKNGWNSTSFESIKNWMKTNGLQTDVLNKKEAQENLQHWIQARYSPEAVQFLSKVFSL